MMPTAEDFEHARDYLDRMEREDPRLISFLRRGRQLETVAEGVFAQARRDGVRNLDYVAVMDELAARAGTSG